MLLCVLQLPIVVVMGASSSKKPTEPVHEDEVDDAACLAAELVGDVNVEFDLELPKEHRELRLVAQPGPERSIDPYEEDPTLCRLGLGAQPYGYGATLCRLGLGAQPYGGYGSVMLPPVISLPSEPQMDHYVVAQALGLPEGSLRSHDRDWAQRCGYGPPVEYFAMFARLRLHAPPALSFDSLADAPPLDICCVVDAGSSMVDKMPQVHAMLEHVIGGMKSSDRIAIVLAHKKSALVVCGLTRATDPNKLQLGAHVSGIEAATKPTNSILYNAIGLCEDLLGARKQRNSATMVLVLTDFKGAGTANSWFETDRIVEPLVSCRASVHVFNFSETEVKKRVSASLGYGFNNRLAGVPPVIVGHSLITYNADDGEVGRAFKSALLHVQPCCATSLSATVAVSESFCTRSGVALSVHDGFAVLHFDDTRKQLDIKNLHFGDTHVVTFSLRMDVEPDFVPADVLRAAISWRAGPDRQKFSAEKCAVAASMD